MCAQQHHPWDLPTGLDCTGIGDQHTKVFAASFTPDAHDRTEQEAENRHEL